MSSDLIRFVFYFNQLINISLIDRASEFALQFNCYAKAELNAIILVWHGSSMMF